MSRFLETDVREQQKFETKYRHLWRTLKQKISFLNKNIDFFILEKVLFKIPKNSIYFNSIQFI